MKKWWVVGVVVVLLLVIVVPVLAAWAWTSSDACMWYRYIVDFPYSEDACDGTGAAVILAGDMIEAEIDFSETGLLEVVGDCSALTVTVLDADFEPVLEDESIPAEVNVVIGDFLDINNNGATCSLTQVCIGGGCEAGSVAVGMIDNFTTTSVFSTASDLVTALGSVIAVIGGILLGWKVLGWLIRRFTA